jgi:hypothetical protein
MAVVRSGDVTKLLVTLKRLEEAMSRVAKTFLPLMFEQSVEHGKCIHHLLCAIPNWRWGVC